MRKRIMVEGQWVLWGDYIGSTLKSLRVVHMDQNWQPMSMFFLVPPDAIDGFGEDVPAVMRAKLKELMAEWL